MNSNPCMKLTQGLEGSQFKVCEEKRASILPISAETMPCHKIAVRGHTHHNPKGCMLGSRS